AQASKALDTVERLRRQVQVPDDRLDRVSARIWALRGELLLAQGKPAQARPLLQRAVDMERKLYGPDVAETRRFQALLDKAGEANAEDAAQGKRDPPQDG
ncbi:MAG: tetratricopeptide repeat protein, partial [Xanthomonadales bacterium]|nr:tetratricopeptide repeat protein [Xanthomonadales bacterium]